MKENKWKKEFRLLLKRSVVTGVPELAATKSNFRRLLRGCVLCFCLVGFSYYTYLFLKAYWKYPTTMDVVIETPEMVDVPAVTFCSYNGIPASTFCNKFPNSCSPMKNYTHFCLDNNNFFCDLSYIIDPNDTLPAIRPYQLPNISRNAFRGLGNMPGDLMKDCKVRYAAGSVNCSQDVKWVSVFDTMGLPNNCYTINGLIGNVKGVVQTMKAKTRIEMKIKTLTEDTFYTATPTAIQMAVHNPRATLNPFKKGFAIKPCYNYFVYVSKVINSLLPFPYNTNCTDYLALWKARGGYGPLSKTQCREECLLNASLKEDKCVDPFLVAYPNVEKICTGPANIKRIFNHCKTGCSRACYRDDVEVDIEEHASLLAKNSMGSTSKCTSVIMLAFNRMEVKKFSYYPKYESCERYRKIVVCSSPVNRTLDNITCLSLLTVELFGYIGGFLGVWLGISLLAVTDLLETIYLTAKALKSCLRKRRKMYQAKSPENQLEMFDPYTDREHRRIKIY